MRDILEEIVAHKRLELEEFKQQLPPRQLYALVERQMAETAAPLPSMQQALLTSDTGIIAEFKRKSPSKGWIKEEGRADVIPLDYQKNGASAVSILTDTQYFGGSDSYIIEARRSGLTLPVLYKNFVVDEYQLFQARQSGASAVLLIAACLKLDECKALLHMAHELGLEVLLEMHAEHELDYADLQPDLFGVNNRDLGTFVTKVENSYHLAARLPQEGCKVSESGISNPSVVADLRRAGFSGFLIGECFMKEPQPGDALAAFIRQAKEPQ